MAWPRSVVHVREQDCGGEVGESKGFVSEIVDASSGMCRAACEFSVNRPRKRIVEVPVQVAKEVLEKRKDFVQERISERCGSRQSVATVAPFLCAWKFRFLRLVGGSGGLAVQAPPREPEPPLLGPARHQVLDIVGLLRHLETSGRGHDPAQQECSVPGWKAALVDLLSMEHVRKPPVRVHGCGLGILQGEQAVDERAQWRTVTLLVAQVEGRRGQQLGERARWGDGGR